MVKHLEHPKFRIAVRGFILNTTGEILMLRRSRETRGEMGFWELPGGGLDHGESPQRALIREIDEETTIVATIHEPLLVWDYLRPDGMQIIGMTFKCHYVSGNVALSHEHDEYTWLAPEKVLDLKIFPELHQELSTLLAQGAFHKTGR